MNIEELRTLLYPLGFLAVTAFMCRFTVQWFYSEYKKKSVVPRLFWQISLVGNVLLTIHSLIQVQYSICCIQACSAVIAWRNLNLMNDPKKHVSFTTVMILLATAIAGTTSAFVLQGMFFFDEIIWARTPVTLWSDPEKEISFFWHLLGTIGLVLFSARFWIQWWYAEKNQESTLNRAFWWLSITGGALTVAYFISLGDIVNLVGPGLGMIPYIRNLMLMNKEKKTLKTTS